MDKTRRVRILNWNTSHNDKQVETTFNSYSGSWAIKLRGERDQEGRCRLEIDEEDDWKVDVTNGKNNWGGGERECWGRGGEGNGGDGGYANMNII